jgi:hypothetical protein
MEYRMKDVRLWRLDEVSQNPYANAEAGSEIDVNFQKVTGMPSTLYPFQ